MTWEKVKLLSWLFKTDVLVSSFSFGGGYVVLPMIRRYFVEEKGLFGEDELMDMAAGAQSSPGAIAINLAVLCGGKKRGGPGRCRRGGDCRGAPAACHPFDCFRLLPAAGVESGGGGGTEGNGSRRGRADRRRSLVYERDCCGKEGTAAGFNDSGRFCRFFPV